MENSFPLITAHTGCLRTPPNSTESVLQGIQAGADIVEVDVNATKDGVAVLFHDQHIRLSSHQNVRIDDLTFEELQTIEKSFASESHPHYHKITRLEEVLDLVQHFRKTINLDLKSQACLKPMAEAVKFRHMVDDVIISGCYKEHAAYVKKQHPDFQVLLNADSSPLTSSGYEDYVKRTCRNAIVASCCGINIHYKDCRQEMLFYSRLRCLPVLIYTVDNVEDMKKFFTAGVHSITTNEVETLFRLKEQSMY
jgi:glycerophosphoryl diester phosphodiesterase